MLPGYSMERALPKRWKGKDIEADTYKDNTRRGNFCFGIRNLPVNFADLLLFVYPLHSISTLKKYGILPD